jgi:hypothetical protein
VAATPRSAANPALDRWVGELLGDPAAVVGRATTAGVAQPVSLLDLGLRPLDVLELARAALDRPGELERRILFAAYGTSVPADASVDLARGPGFQPRTMRTFPELFEVARQLAAVLAQARPLAARDLAVLDGSEATIPAELALAEVTVAQQAREACRLAREDLLAAGSDPAALHEPLRRAAAFLAEVFPGGAELAAPAIAELTRRLDEASKLLAELPVSPAEQVATASAALKTIFGESYLRLPRVQLPAETIAELGDMAARSASLKSGDPEGPRRLVQQMAWVRPAMAAWRKLWMFAGAVSRAPTGGRARQQLEVAQLPYLDDEAWVGGTFPAGKRPRASRLSLLVQRDGDSLPSLAGGLSGLVVDAWTEIVPNEEEQTGVAFHHDSPGAEAAQVVLLAVPPDPARSTWSLADLLATLNETFELARLRAVEPEALGELGQVLPATYLTASTRSEPLSGARAQIAALADDVSTRFDGLVVGELQVKDEP